MNGTIRIVVVGVAEMHDQDPKIAPAGEDPVLAPAVELAERLGARLHVVCAFERPDPVLCTYTHALDDASEAQQKNRRSSARCGHKPAASQAGTAFAATPWKDGPTYNSAHSRMKWMWIC